MNSNDLSNIERVQIINDLVNEVLNFYHGQIVTPRILVMIQRSLEFDLNLIRQSNTIKIHGYHLPFDEELEITKNLYIDKAEVRGIIDRVIWNLKA